MSKGRGGGGNGGGGIGATARSIISAAGGLAKGGSYLHEGFRPGSTAHFQQVYAGKSKTEVDKIARSGQPIKISINKPGRGKPHIEVVDGRHRLTGAAAAGASRIRAAVTVHEKVKGEWITRGTWTGNVKV